LVQEHRLDTRRFKAPLAVSEWSDFNDRYGGVIRVYEAAGNAIETHEHAGDFKEP